MKIRIVGSGLIGTSLGLALRSQGHELEMVDQKLANQQLAADLVGSSTLDQPDLVVIAVPSESVFEVLHREYIRYPQARFIDISGLKSNLLLEVARIPGLNTRFLGTHPMAGRELVGPEGARSDLFEGRAWIITPSSQTSTEFLRLVREVVESTGASVFELEPSIHDEQIALVSHLPQVISSLLGGELAERSPEELTLAGAGLRDTSRLAGSSPALWGSLLTMNAQEILPLLESFKGSIDKLIDRLERGDKAGVEAILALGNQGRSRIPGKHGGKVREYHLLPVVIQDKPGELARIFTECDLVGVNVEDLSIEHSPGQETGLITLALSLDDADLLHAHLLREGWLAHKPRSS